MKGLFWIILLFPVSCLVNGCNDDKDSFKPDAAVLTGFKKMYPDVGRVTWKNKQPYNVAEFTMSRMEYDAWFLTDGSWFMTEIDLAYGKLPDVVKTTFTTSVFANWKIDDIDFIQRNGFEDLYLIDIEKEGGNDKVLYIAGSGILIKVQEGDSGEMMPELVPSAIRSFITSTYPKALIVDIDKSATGYEVDILDNGVPKEVCFDLNEAWQKTEEDIIFEELPDEVKNAFNSSEYVLWQIDDIVMRMLPGNVTHYVLEVEADTMERTLVYDESGDLVP